MTRPAAVIFDLDGTLIDSERMVIEVGAAILAAMGIADGRAVLTSLGPIDPEEGVTKGSHFRSSSPTM